MLERDRVFGRVRHDILACHLKPGDELREIDLARRYGVSKSPVRDALQRLEFEGLVEIEPRRGHRVRPLSKRDAEDLIEIRAILESAVVTKLAKCATEAELASLDAFRTTSRKGIEGFAEYNRDFHVALAEMSRNRRLAEETRRIMELYERLALVSLASVNHTVGLEKPLGEHVAIIDAVQGRNGRLAARLVKRHVASSRSHILRGLSRQVVVA